MNTVAESDGNVHPFWPSLLEGGEFWAALIGAGVGGAFTLIATWLANKAQLLRINRQQLGNRCIDLARILDVEYLAARQFKAWDHEPWHRVSLPFQQQLSAHKRDMQFWVRSAPRLDKHFNILIDNLKSNACFCPKQQLSERWHTNESRRAEIQAQYVRDVIDALIALPKRGECQFSRSMKSAHKRRGKSLKDLLKEKPCDQTTAPASWKATRLASREQAQIPKVLSEGMNYIVAQYTVSATTQDQNLLRIELEEALQENGLGLRPPSEDNSVMVKKFLSDGGTLEHSGADQRGNLWKQVHVHCRWLYLLGFLDARGIRMNARVAAKRISKPHTTMLPLLTSVRATMSKPLAEVTGIPVRYTAEELYDHVNQESVKHYECYEHVLLDHGCSVPFAADGLFLCAEEYQKQLQLDPLTPWPQLKECSIKSIEQVSAVHGLYPTEMLRYAGEGQQETVPDRQ